MVLELRRDVFPPRSGPTVYFAWPEAEVGPYGTPGEAGDAQADAAIAWIASRYTPATRWVVTQWQTGRLSSGQPVVLARQIGG